MKPTKLEWEDVIQFEEVEGYGKSIWKNEDKYFLVSEEGTVASWLAVYDLPQELFSLLDSGERSLLEISWKIKHDSWPPTEEEKKASEKQFVLKGLTPLIANPKSWELFTQEELETLIPLAEKKWIDWRGKLPDDYVSPLKQTKRNSMTTEIQQYKNCTVLKNNNDYQILWSRGKEVLNFPISQELAKRVSKSEKDALEVMFYCEHHRWPKADELDDYNHSNTIVHRGDGFVVYETDGYYEISFFKEIGGAMGPEVRYPITKELKDKAFESSRGAYEVMIYAETGHWPISDQ